MKKKEKALEASECSPVPPTFSVIVIEYGATSFLLDFHFYRGSKL